MKTLIQIDSSHTGLNTVLGFICGILGGTIDYFTRAQPMVIFAILQAAFTAFLCGAAGVAGKELILYCKKKFFTGSAKKKK